MNDMGGMGKLVPGFEFLQNLAKGAGAAMPHVGQWVAPTLDPAELDKRIEELRTVQFWLEQNARMLATTIQALEVQRMTLSTLQTMNVSFGELTEALKVKLPESTPAPASAAAPAAPPAAAAAARAPREAKGTPEAVKPAAARGAIDPMQWWGALTQQFSQIAAQALKDGTGDGSAPTGVAAAASAAASAPARKAARPARQSARKAPAKGAR